jgi:type I restriction enzyme S subunit
MSEALEQFDLRKGYKEVQFGPKTLVVPSDWSTNKFKDVFQRRRESIDEIEDEKVKYVGLKHIESGQLKINGYDEDGRERSSSRVFRKGDVLFGKLRPNLNKAAVAPFSGVCSSDIIPIYAEKDAHQQYLPNLMHSKLVRDRVVSTMEGTNLPRTSWDDVKKILIPLPSLPEQRRIADILSTVDDQIKQTDEIIEETEILKEGLMQDLYRFGVENDSYSIHRVGPREIEIPTHWQLRAVDELKSTNTSKKAIRGGPPGGRIKKSDRSEEGAKLYVQENVIHNDFERRGDYLSAGKFEELKSAEVDPGDVLITRSGTIGKSEVFPNDAQRGILGSSLIRVKVNEDIIRPQYLSQFLADSHVAQSQIKSMSHGGTRTGVNNKIVKSIQVPIPPIEEQDRISEILKTVEERIQQEQKHRDDLKDLKRGLMQDLLTGKVRVNTD